MDRMKIQDKIGQVNKPAEADRKATQKFEILNILVGHCEGILSADKIEEIMVEIEIAVTTGACACAFK